MYSLPQLHEFYEQFCSKNNFHYGPDSLYEPVRHIMNIKGKRIRPLLCLLACEMFGGDLNEAVNAAYSLEVFHNFTLVHDDVMDNAPVRRGVPTVHEKYGVSEAILAGDVMLSYVYKYLLQISSPQKMEVLNLFTKTSIEIFEGQQMDLDFEKRETVPVEEYLKMIEFKTSVLLAASLQIGAIIGGAGKGDQKKLYEFGLNLGLSFQIKDDWLDAFGKNEKVGKKIGGDIIQNKKTFLLITALNDSSEEQRKKLNELLSEKNKEKKISGVIEIFSALDISGKTQQKINELYEKSLQCLNDVKLADDKKETLRALASSIHHRDY